jgi:hypothetical protein
LTSLLQGQANRRQLLLGSACIISCTLAPTSAMAAEEGAALPDASVVLHDSRFPLAADLRQRLQLNGARILPLADDPVRMWRDQLAALLQPRDARLLGVTRWPEFLMIRGLAAESRRHVRYERADATTGAIVWLIA